MENNHIMTSSEQQKESLQGCGACGQELFREAYILPLRILKSIADLRSDGRTNQAIQTQFSCLWDILTALRGPDDEEDELKELTTHRVRSYLFPHDFSCKPLTKEKIIRRNALLGKCSYHFARHFSEALRSLKTLGFKVPDDELIMGLEEGG